MAQVHSIEISLKHIYCLIQGRGKLVVAFQPEIAGQKRGLWIDSTLRVHKINTSKYNTAYHLALDDQFSTVTISAISSLLIPRGHFVPPVYLEVVGQDPGSYADRSSPSLISPNLSQVIEPARRDGESTSVTMLFGPSATLLLNRCQCRWGVVLL